MPAINNRQSYSFVVATADSPYLPAIASLLHSQWPRGGSIQDYQLKITSKEEVDELPCSFILLIDSDSDTARPTIIGHVRITKCVDDSSGTAVAATYIIVKKPCRSRGHGRILMKLLEDVVIRLGYHYIYVWTRTAVDFYKKCGYVETHKISLHRPCLKRLEGNQVSQLEAMLLASSRMRSKQNQQSFETVMLPPDNKRSDDDGDDDDDDDGDVWLRKRLVEQLPMETIDMQDRIQELQHAVAQKYSDSIQWKYHLIQLPWTRQVGPSCGLAALRMVSGYYEAINNSNDNIDRDSVDDSCPSLLAYAKAQGFSHDGEIFDARHLCKIAKEYCHLSCKLVSFKNTSQMDLLKMLLSCRPLILAYDSQPFTRLPCSNNGRNAHYGIIVGVIMGQEGTGEEHQWSLLPLDFAEDDEGSASMESFVQSCSQCLLLVQHSLSKKLSIASWDDFSRSNEQLCDVDSSKFRHARTTMNLKDHLVVIKGHFSDEQREKDA
jgi:N-acetylglutamate synthase-like GNAT family acetyltransferase